MAKFEEVKGTPVFNIKDEHGKDVEGASITGEFKEIVAGEYGNNYVLATDKGDQLVFGGSVLNTKMNRVKIGQQVRITYLGEVKAKNSRNTYKDFKVEVAK